VARFFMADGVWSARRRQLSVPRVRRSTSGSRQLDFTGKSLPYDSRDSAADY